MCEYIMTRKLSSYVIYIYLYEDSVLVIHAHSCTYICMNHKKTIFKYKDIYIYVCVCV